MSQVILGAVINEPRRAWPWRRPQHFPRYLEKSFSPLTGSGKTHTQDAASQMWQLWQQCVCWKCRRAQQHFHLRWLKRTCLNDQKFISGWIWRGQYWLSNIDYYLEIIKLWSIALRYVTFTIVRADIQITVNINQNFHRIVNIPDLAEGYFPLDSSIKHIDKKTLWRQIDRYSTNYKAGVECGKVPTTWDTVWHGNHEQTKMLWKLHLSKENLKLFRLKKVFTFCPFKQKKL